MPWDIEDRESAVVIIMNSNSVGVMSEGFFEDLGSTFSTVRRMCPSKPVVLSSGAKMFSPGLDLEQCVPLFRRGNKAEINRWFEGFLNSMLSVFEHPAPTVAAIEGHAIAGGFILALCCDMRVAEKGKALVGLNETSIGFPMPRSLDVLVTGVLGRCLGRKIIDGGKLYTVEEASELGIVQVAGPGETISSSLDCLAKAGTGFHERKEPHNRAVCKDVREAFAGIDSKVLADKLSSAGTVYRLEGILHNLKKAKAGV